MLVPTLTVIALAIVIMSGLMALNWFIWGLTYSESQAARHMINPATQNSHYPDGGGFRSAA